MRSTSIQQRGAGPVRFVSVEEEGTSGPEREVQIGAKSFSGTHGRPLKNTPKESAKKKGKNHRIRIEHLNLDY